MLFLSISNCRVISLCFSCSSFVPLCPIFDLIYNNTFFGVLKQYKQSCCVQNLNMFQWNRKRLKCVHWQHHRHSFVLCCQKASLEFLCKLTVSYVVIISSNSKVREFKYAYYRKINQIYLMDIQSSAYHCVKKLPIRYGILRSNTKVYFLHEISIWWFWISSKQSGLVWQRNRFQDLIYVHTLS